MNRGKYFKYFLFLFASLALVTLPGCDGSTFTPANINLSQFDVKLTDIGFRRNSALFSQDTLSISGESLLFRVDVTAKDSFTGEPFKTRQVGNKDIGIQTFVQSTPAVWLALLSRDGYYFSSHGPLTWTPEELRLPDSSERDYYKIQSMKENRVKHVTIYVPSSDKAVVALLQDSNKLAAELQQQQWKYFISGDWLYGEDLPKESDAEYIRDKFEELFNRYFKLVIVDSDGLQKLMYPDGTTKFIDAWSGKGKFTTPLFTVSYDRIKTTAVVKTTGRFQYYLYDVNGAKLSGSEMTYQPDKTYPGSMSVKPGKSYYIEITAPAEMQWTFRLEETNLPP